MFHIEIIKKCVCSISKSSCFPLFFPLSLYIDAVENMFSTESCELSIPKTVHSKRESASITPATAVRKHVDTATLINNVSQSTFESPALEQTSTRVSSTIMSGSIATQQAKPKENAMTAKTHETTISIKQRVPVKAIRIERDYSLGDGITRFQTEFPMELTGKVTPEQFTHTITEINKLMDYADRLSWRIVLENIVETLSIYIWPIFFSTHYQRAVKRLLAFIESENSNIYNPQSLSISDPVKAAFLFIEINFYE